MNSHNCKNDPQHFCYVCGKYTLIKDRRCIQSSKSFQDAYSAYFGLKIINQDQWWTPHNVCTNCYTYLIQWKEKKKQSMAFGRPMIWIREPKNHIYDCYFCMVGNVKGFNKRFRSLIMYPHVPSVKRPQPHGENCPVPVPPLRTTASEYKEDDG